jgi:hypothetical protein
MHRYKPLGRNFGGLPGKKDGFETYTVSTSASPNHPEIVG